MTNKVIKAALVLGVVAALAPAAAMAGDAPKKGSKTFDIQYVYKPVGYSEVPGVGKITVLEAVGKAANLKGELNPYKDGYTSKCQMVSIEAGGKTWSEGACVVNDGDGDRLFSTFDSRNLDASQPKLNCGSYVTTGGTGKFKGFTAKGAYSCAMVEAPKDVPAGGFAMDIAHNENWQTN